MIKIKTLAEIEAMKPAGALSKLALRKAGTMVVPGTRTIDIDRVVESLIRIHGATPAFKGYLGFPASICCSINNEIVHGIPGEGVVLQEGDIVSIDTGAVLNGWVGDNAWTFYCGTPSAEDRALCEVTRDCLYLGIQEAVVGNHVGDIGFAIAEHAEKHGYGVVREYVGHGVGHDMHEEPNVPNYGKRGRGVRLQEGMVLAIEPMIVLNSPKNETQTNRWTVVTADKGTAAHYENTIAITKDGPVILTADEKGATCPMEGGPDRSDSIPEI